MRDIYVAMQLYYDSAYMHGAVKTDHFVSTNFYIEQKDKKKQNCVQLFQHIILSINRIAKVSSIIQHNRQTFCAKHTFYKGNNVLPKHFLLCWHYA